MATNRRDFLKGAASIVTASAAAAAAARQPSESNAKQPEGEKKEASVVKIEKRAFGKTGMQVAVLGFGSAEIGFERTEQGTVDKILNAALDLGLNVVDTAECYVDSEEQIGKAVSHRRKEYFLFTKCGHVLANGQRGDAWDKPGVLASIERSLKRLKTDVVDLVQLHSCSLELLKKGEVIEALEEAKKQGKTRFIGYSGDSQAARYAVECGRFDSLQTSVNIADQEAIELTLPLAKKANMGVIAKRPIANAAWRYDKTPDNGYHTEYWKRLQELKYPFAQGEARNTNGPDSAAGIAMRFTAMQAVHVLIVGTSKPERWQQNAELLATGPLAAQQERDVRDRWKGVAKPDWIGQT